MMASSITADTIPAAVAALHGPVLAVTHPRQGYSSQVAVVHTAQGSFVVKRHSGPYCWLAEREYGILRSLSSSTLLMPRPWLFYESTTSTGPENWIAMQYLSGETLHSVLSEQPDQQTRIALIGAFGRVLSALHRAPIPAALNGRAYSRQNHTDWTEHNIGLVNRDERLDILERLRSYRPATVRQALTHGDFTARNVLVTGTTISGIIDWAWGGIGDPRADIAAAIQPHREVALTRRDIEAFYQGYGCQPLSEPDRQYFSDLYAFGH